VREDFPRSKDHTRQKRNAHKQERVGISHGLAELPSHHGGHEEPANSKHKQRASQCSFCHRDVVHGTSPGFLLIGWESAGEIF